MNIINVTNWELDEEKHISGTRQKFWLKHPSENQIYMFKVPKENTGEVWAEKIVSDLGKVLGLNMMDVSIAKHNDMFGSLAKNFREETEIFYEGGDLFYSIFEDFDRFNLKYYDIANILDILKGYNLERRFLQIPIFDTFVANQDRHCDNWGIIYRDNSYDLSPIYDNGASLGYQLEPSHIINMLKNGQMFTAFSNRSRSLIGLSGKRKPKSLDLLSWIRRRFPYEVKEEFERINMVDQPMVESIISPIPQEAMDDIYKEWVVKLLLYRKEWLLGWEKGGI